MRLILFAVAGLVASATAAAATEVTFDFTAPGGFQTFTTPETGLYQIKCIGASGGPGGPNVGGRGAEVSAIFELLAGTELTIAVGQMGFAGSNGGGGGGGGGTFVVAPVGLLEAAGGGGGGGGFPGADGLGLDGNPFEPGLNGVAGGAGGTVGQGGGVSFRGGAGGGGYSTSGATEFVMAPVTNATGGEGYFAVPQSLAGGAGEFRPNNGCCGGDGGYGGGGGAVGLITVPLTGGGGGGGGYSGGGGGSIAGFGGRGGGSFLAASALAPVRGLSPAAAGNGQVNILFGPAAIPEPTGLFLLAVGGGAVVIARSLRARASLA